jgi:hypothetical protein
VDGKASSGSPNADAPYIWKNKTFPKTLNISDDFSASERSNITAMASAWDGAVDNAKNFFTFGQDVADKSNIVSADELYDNELGIYKTTIWPDDIPSSALAVTQIFGRRYNVGSPEEYVAIEHADILINYDRNKGYNFDSVDDADYSGYDLRTVVLHEMGHFLGLGHIPTFTRRESAYSNMTLAQYKASSVMYPSISSIEEKRVPTTRDENELYYKYVSTGAAGGSAMSAGTRRYEPRDTGLESRIILELHADGTCVHKENGAVLKRHSLK